MRVELKHIKGDVLEQEYTCRPADFPEVVALAEAGAARYREPVSFLLRLQQTGSMVEIRGRFEAVIELSCGRCLRTFEQQLSENFSLTFAPQKADAETEEERQLKAEELDLISYQDDTLELKEPLQEQLLMAVPLRAVCAEDCRGLCPQCGADLNQRSCGCERRPFNSKFGLLAQIRPE